MSGVRRKEESTARSKRSCKVGATTSDEKTARSGNALGKKRHEDGPTTRSQRKREPLASAVGEKKIYETAKRKWQKGNLVKSKEGNSKTLRTKHKKQSSDKTKGNREEDNTWPGTERKQEKVRERLTNQKRKNEQGEKADQATSEEVTIKKRKIETGEQNSAEKANYKYKSCPSKENNRTDILLAGNKEPKSGKLNAIRKPISTSNGVDSDASESADEEQSDDDYVPSSDSDQECGDGDDEMGEDMEVQVVIDEKTGEMVAYCRDKAGNDSLVH